MNYRFFNENFELLLKLQKQKYVTFVKLKMVKNYIKLS